MTAIECDPMLSRRDQIHAQESALWTQTLGREVIVSPMPEALTDEALSGLEKMRFQPIYIPSLALPHRKDLLDKPGFHAGLHRIKSDNPDLIQTSKEQMYMASVLACYAKHIIPGEIPTEAKWAAIETWDGLTSNQVDMLESLSDEQEDLIEARYGLPLTRFLAPHHDDHRIEEKGDHAAQTTLAILRTLSEIGLHGTPIVVPTVVDAFLLSKRSDRGWKFSEEGEWTKTTYMDPNPDIEVKSHCYLVAKNLGTGNPELAAYEGAKHVSQVGLRPMITF